MMGIFGTWFRLCFDRYVHRSFSFPLGCFLWFFVLVQTDDPTPCLCFFFFFFFFAQLDGLSDWLGFWDSEAVFGGL